MEGNAGPVLVSDDKSFRLMCWNINGLAPTLPNIKLKHKSLPGFFKEYRLSACCLQEVKLPESKVTKEMACVPGFESIWATSRARLGYSGCTTWLASPLWSPASAEVDCLGGGEEDIDQEGRIVITDCGPFTILNAYAPNAGEHPARPRLGFKLRFLSALLDKMNQLTAEGRQIILVGDLNIAAAPQDVHPSFDLDSMYSVEEVGLLHRLLGAYPDVWRSLHPDTQGCYSVWEERTNARAYNRGCRIDYVCVSPGLLPLVASCEIVYSLPPKWSDHAPLLLELKPHPTLAPPGPHPPCALSTSIHRRFNDPRQPTILAALMGAGRRNAARGGGGGGDDGGGGGSRGGTPPQVASQAKEAGASGQVQVGGATQQAQAAITQQSQAGVAVQACSQTEGQVGAPEQGQAQAVKGAEAVRVGGAGSAPDEVAGSKEGRGKGAFGDCGSGGSGGGEAGEEGCPSTSRVPAAIGCAGAVVDGGAASVASGVAGAGVSDTTSSKARPGKGRDGAGGRGSKVGEKRGAGAARDGEREAKSQRSITSFFGKKG